MVLSIREHSTFIACNVHVHLYVIHSVEHTSGVVVDVGHGVATCCAVWEGEECPGSSSCDPLECTASAVAKMVQSVLLTSRTEEMRVVLRERVVVTGKNTGWTTDNAQVTYLIGPAELLSGLYFVEYQTRTLEF